MNVNCGSYNNVCHSPMNNLLQVKVKENPGMQQERVSQVISKTLREDLGQLD